MAKLISKITIALGAVLFSALAINAVLAVGSLTKASDKISDSAPLAGSNHLIKFKTHSTIPGGGSVRIIFEPEAFYAPPVFDFGDIDFATANNSAGPFSNRSLDAAFIGGSDAAAVVTGSSTSVTIALNPANPINAGTYVEIKLGDNASYGEDGSTRIINPPDLGSYKIFASSYSPGGVMLDRVEIMTAIADKVDVSFSVGRIRANGYPKGSLVAGTTQTIISLTTNVTATCSYSAILDTPYNLMPDQFSNTGGNYHSGMIYGLVGGEWYYYYVKCSWLDGYIDTTDFTIYFYIELASDGDGVGDEGGTGGGTGEDSGAGSGSDPGSGNAGGGAEGPGSGGGTGGGGGGGGGGGFSPTSSSGGDTGLNPYPDQIPPSVTLDGWAFPMSSVNILKDGILAKKVNADSGAKFRADINDLREGVYTFNIWALDGEGRRSVTKSTTFWVKENTYTVQKVFLPPTISANSASVELGASLDISGITIPLKKVELWFDDNLKNLLKKEAYSDDSGKWTYEFKTEELASKGNYFVRARTFEPSEGYSDFSVNLNFGVGQAPGGELDTCSRADINRDKKINLIDFSILLYNWESTRPEADINLDGKVNLVDFSLMMYCWTG